MTSQAGANGAVEFSLNYATSQTYSVARTSNGAYNLTGGGNYIKNHNITPRFKWTTILGGRFNNEFIGGYSRVRDQRGPNEPFVNIVVTSGGGYNLLTGAEISSQANSLDQDVWELTDNLSFDVGKHRLLVGTHNEFFGFHNVFFQRAVGQWNFSSIANFEAGIASQYQRNLPAGLAGVPGGRADGPIADFNVNQWGLYAQDNWSPLRNLQLTVGLRADVPIFPLTPTTNPKLLSQLDFNTGQIPSGNTLWSPRLGFNYDLRGRGDLIVRGGAGVFSGRPAYVWVSNAYTNTGLEQVALNCNGVGTATVPNFSTYGLDPNDQPTACAGAGGLSNAAPDINFFKSDFKFPQALRLNLGVDKQLPWGMVANIDGMYSNNFNSLYITDYNLTAIDHIWPDTGLGTLAGEGGRSLYGNATLATPAPTRRSASFRNILVHENRGKDYSWAAIFQLQKRFANRVEFNAGYTRSRSYDLMSATSSVALSNYGFSTLDGPLSARNLRTSSFDRPNKISISGLVHLPYNIDASMQYVGISGSPYGYVVAGDANADGIGSSANLTGQQNDLFYVPKDVNDISFSAAVDGNAALKQATFDSLNAYINKDSCLADQRGQIMERN
ncbi:MAG: TonB-dependent receptor, partial [Gemmatimonadetes bacterium]|nr:TonB-dependent receptor [Gemmatimonadota bacterium]